MHKKISFSFLILVLCLTKILSQESQESGTKLFETVDPSVVAIQIEKAGGSGMIISEDGYILTNGHVISDATNENPLRTSEKITVIMNDEKKYVAKVIGHSLDPDVALLKIETDRPLIPVKFSDSDTIKTGQKCYALGMPVGHKRTLTSGIISNTERYIGTYTTVFQTDAAINPGNSGGPLFNESGEVIGLNTYSGRGDGLGFTLPAKVALTMKSQFQKNGYFKRAIVPFFFTQHLYDELVQKFNVESGVLVEFVEKDSLAYKAGMRAGDIIVEKNGAKIKCNNLAQLLNFEWEMATQEIGSDLNLTLIRNVNGEKKTISFSAKMIEDEPQPQAGYQSGEIKETTYVELGLGVMPIVTTMKYIYDLHDAEGVMVSKSITNSPAFKADLRRSNDLDIIKEVNGKPIKNIEEFIRIFEDALRLNAKYIPLKIQRGKIQVNTALKPEYKLKGKKIAIILLPNAKINDLERIRRYFESNGAVISYYGVKKETFVFQPKTRGDLSFEIEINKTYSELLDEKLNALVICPTKDLNADAKIDLSFIGSQKTVICGYDNSPKIIFDQISKFKEKKITSGKETSADLISSSANFTGKNVESDGEMITSTGLNEDVIDEFVQKIKDKIIEGETD